MMGNSKLWYYPGSGGGGIGTPTVETIDFGETVSDLQITPYRMVHDSLSIGGAFSRSSRRVGMIVRIVNERFTDDTLAEKLYGLQSHIERGGAFSFAVDSSNIFCAFSKGGVPGMRGQTNINLERTLFSAYGATTLDASGDGDVVHIECPSPRSSREEARVEGYNADILTIDGLNYDHDGPMMVRHRDFFPVLFWPERESGSPPLTHDHRISWSWDITCEAFPAHAFAMFEGEGPSAGGTSEGRGGGSLDSVISGVDPSSDPVKGIADLTSTGLSSITFTSG